MYPPYLVYALKQWKYLATNKWLLIQEEDGNVYSQWNNRSSSSFLVCDNHEWLTSGLTLTFNENVILGGIDMKMTRPSPTFSLNKRHFYATKTWAHHCNNHLRIHCICGQHNSSCRCICLFPHKQCLCCHWHYNCNLQKWKFHNHHHLIWEIIWLKNLYT